MISSGIDNYGAYFDHLIPFMYDSENTNPTVISNAPSIFEAG